MFLFDFSCRQILPTLFFCGNWFSFLFIKVSRQWTLLSCSYIHQCRGIELFVSFVVFWHSCLSWWNTREMQNVTVQLKRDISALFRVGKNGTEMTVRQRGPSVEHSSGWASATSRWRHVHEFWRIAPGSEQRKIVYNGLVLKGRQGHPLHEQTQPDFQ